MRKVSRWLREMGKRNFTYVIGKILDKVIK